MSLRTLMDGGLYHIHETLGSETAFETLKKEVLKLRSNAICVSDKSYAGRTEYCVFDGNPEYKWPHRGLSVWSFSEFEAWYNAAERIIDPK